LNFYWKFLFFMETEKYSHFYHQQLEGKTGKLRSTNRRKIKDLQWLKQLEANCCVLHLKIHRIVQKENEKLNLLYHFSHFVPFLAAKIFTSLFVLILEVFLIIVVKRGKLRSFVNSFWMAHKNSNKKHSMDVQILRTVLLDHCDVYCWLGDNGFGSVESSRSLNAICEVLRDKQKKFSIIHIIKGQFCS
jgi:hypothetical protein